MTTTSHRKWMRGLAWLFIIVGTLGLASAALLVLVGKDEFGELDLLAVGLSSTVILISAIMIWNGSRFAALFLTLWIATSLLEFSFPVNVQTSGKIILTLFYLGLCAALIWHSIRYHQKSAEDGNFIKGNTIIRWGGLAVLLPIAALTLIGFSAQHVSRGQVILSGKHIPQDQLVWMSENKLLQYNETPLLYYALSVAPGYENGNLLSDKYIGVWWQADDSLSNAWLKLGQICEIEQLDEGDAELEAVYHLTGPGEDNWLKLWLTTENDRHREFINRLNYLNDRNMHPEILNACAENREIDLDSIAASNGIKTHTVAGDLITDKQMIWLKEQDFIYHHEKPLDFYSYGVYAIREGGSLLTDTYFGGWFEENGELISWWAELGNICTIETVSRSEDEAFAMYKVSTPGDDDWLEFRLSTINDGDQHLIQNLRKLNTEAKTEDDEKACKSKVSPGAIEEAFETIN